MIDSSSLDKPLFNHPETAPGFLLWQSAMYWQREVNKVLADYKLTYTQFVVLVVAGWLKKQNKEIFQHQAARYARIDRMMTSRIITSLEKKKYIKRIKDSGDARANRVQITDQGNDTLLGALRAVSELEHLFFKLDKHGDTPALFMKELLSTG